MIFFSIVKLDWLIIELRQYITQTNLIKELLVEPIILYMFMINKLVNSKLINYKLI